LLPSSRSALFLPTPMLASLSLILSLSLSRYLSLSCCSPPSSQFFRGSDCAGMAYEFASKLGMPSAAVQRVRTVLEQHLAQYCQQHNPTVRPALRLRPSALLLLLLLHAVCWANETVSVDGWDGWRAGVLIFDCVFVGSCLTLVVFLARSLCI
jgi:hypothetical protein